MVKRQLCAVMLSGGLCGFLPCGANRDDNCGSAWSAGICAIEAKPRLALAPTIPTRSLSLAATISSANDNPALA
jgi:hypothetical protein